MELRTQHDVEKGMRRIWTGVAVVATLAAYWFEDQLVAWLALCVTAVLTALVVVPDWPFWAGKNQFKWKGVPQ
ncbi:hypothetical protein BASA81_000290 [Batrachochytrium salamandrivorans]|nr:hypothetical protein BASA81_000290 [Batrachochytrium salamandrivorans]